MTLTVKLFSNKGEIVKYFSVAEGNFGKWLTVGNSSDADCCFTELHRGVEVSFLAIGSFVFVRSKIGLTFSFKNVTFHFEKGSYITVEVGHSDLEDDLSKVDFACLSAGEQNPIFQRVFRSISAVLEQEIWAQRGDNVTDDFVLEITQNEINMHLTAWNKDFFCKEENNNTNFDENFLFDFVSVFWSVFFRLRRYGILSGMFNDKSVTDIMFFGKKQCMMDTTSGIKTIDLLNFPDFDLRTLIDRLVFEAGRRIDESRPFCDFRLPDGSRVHAIIPPLAIDGPSLTIRRFRKGIFGEKDLLDSGFLDSTQLSFLKKIVGEGQNVLVSGSTGSGKTTLLNILSSYIPKSQRILTVEDAAELQIESDHVVRLETREANSEGLGQVTIRELVRNSLRMRPDRVIVGECRGPEAFDMVQSMNTGHRGCMTTLHANSPYDALLRLETLSLMAGEGIPHTVIRRQISGAIDVVVQIERRNGIRRVSEIAQLKSLTKEGDYVLENLHDFPRKILTNICKSRQANSCDAQAPDNVAVAVSASNHLQTGPSEGSCQ